MPTKPMIEYQDITVSYDSFTALPKFNLTVTEGEFFTLLGPSGCGKSTALRTLAGFINPASGRLLIDGANVTHAPSHKRGIGMVFQNYALFPSMRVGENIAYGLKTAKVSKSEIVDKVAQIAHQVGLSPEQLDKNIASLSGGQQQRVAIARALVTQPKILLLDEPLSNLDAKLRQRLRAQLKDLQYEFGITTIYVTHDQGEALALSDRMAVLNKGHIEQVGTPEELYSNSATDFVCNFLGEVNKLSPTHITELNKQGLDLSPAHSHYIRPERLRIARPTIDAAEAKRVFTLPATVQNYTYLGMRSTIAVDCLGTIFNIGILEDGHAPTAAALTPGNRIEIHLIPEHIRSIPSAN
ncbi:ABC transporter ATP-binding protein [Corynebacterium lowii]|uniref:Trehalose import ATP-binding protein SugC n=1 Tax=Corynebacterium lowii TaxID=1544413 RepID=A0A0Q0UFZ7_9CORY|nr:ABC transporter ATP-binding protein [Corynebacterium lowii]KQB87104.1 Spermidine/putrescine import ATP-binding protein PotA [Corynebacterium lowii]MDP9852310.1 iron(III) transport system ATP-binding protein [Corynebacterium lowii]